MPPSTPPTTSPPPTTSTPTTTDNIRNLLHLDGYAKGFMAEHIRGLIRTYAISGMKDPGIEGLIWDIMFIDPVTMRHFAQFQEMWKHRRSRHSPYREWWKAFRDFLRDCLDKTRTQMNKYHKENPPGPDHDSVHSDDEARTKWFPGTPKMHPPFPETECATSYHLRSWPSRKKAETR